MIEPLFIKQLLVSVFILGGMLLILIGFLLWQKLWSKQTVEIKATCISVNEHTAKTGIGSNKTFFPHAKQPVYQYEYMGHRYTSSSLLASNRKGYRPRIGPCTIKINAKHPEKVYSSERTILAKILIGIGSLWMVIAVVTLLLF